MLGAGHAAKGGIGAASMKVDGTTIAAIVCVNALGNVYDYRNGDILAGTDLFAGKDEIEMPPMGGNTTIGVLATDAKLDKIQAHRLAMLGHDGMAMAIRPVHTMYDGDTVFSLATGKAGANTDMVFAFAAEVFARAVCNAVTRDDQ
jgi:L-aminopeptidase/D-esterase-like protein